MCGQASVPQTVPPARPVDRSGAVVAPQGATWMWGCEHRRCGRKAAAGRTTTAISPRRPIRQGHGASGVQSVRRQPARNVMCGSAEAWWSGLRLQMKPGRRGPPARACSQVTARSVCRATGARRVSTDVCTTCPDFVRATGSVRDSRSCSTRRGCNKATLRLYPTRRIVRGGRQERTIGERCHQRHGWSRSGVVAVPASC